MLSDDNVKHKLSIKEIVLKGTIIAIIVSVPSLIAFVIVWKFFDNFETGLMLGVVIHLFTMVISFKISKKLLVNR